MSAPKYLRSIAVHYRAKRIVDAVGASGVSYVVYLLESALLPIHSPEIAKTNIFLADGADPLMPPDALGVASVTTCFDKDTFLRLTRQEQREYFLNVLHTALMEVATEHQLSASAISAARDQVLAGGFKLDTVWKSPKQSRDKKQTATVVLEIGESTSAFVIFKRRDGVEFARTLFSIVPSSKGPIDFLVGDLAWVEPETVRVTQANGRDYWLITPTGDVEFVFEPASIGNPHGLYQLGTMYWEGKYVLTDRVKALSLISTAAEGGYAHAVNFINRNVHSQGGADHIL